MLYLHRQMRRDYKIKFTDKLKANLWINLNLVKVHSLKELTSYIVSYLHFLNLNNILTLPSFLPSLKLRVVWHELRLCCFLFFDIFTRMRASRQNRNKCKLSIRVSDFSIGFQWTDDAKLPKGNTKQTQTNEQRWFLSAWMIFLMWSIFEQKFLLLCTWLISYTYISIFRKYFDKLHFWKGFRLPKMFFKAGKIKISQAFLQRCLVRKYLGNVLDIQGKLSVMECIFHKDLTKMLSTKDVSSLNFSYIFRTWTLTETPGGIIPKFIYTSSKHDL